jgi:hypothetical protein
LIFASELGKSIRNLWGCNFDYDEEGKISAIKNVVSFTEKTRFLFAIEKGQIDPEFKNDPYAVNRPMNEAERPIPLRNMIYLGDGPSDIPCMSIVLRAKGNVIGILNKKEPHRAWALGYGRRASLTVPPDFRETEHGFIQLREAIIRMADRIKNEVETQGDSGTAPAY